MSEKHLKKKNKHDAAQEGTEKAAKKTAGEEPKTSGAHAAPVKKKERSSKKEKQKEERPVREKKKKERPAKEKKQKAVRPAKEKKKKDRPERFTQETTPEQRISRKDRIRVILGLTVVVLLVAAAAVLYYYRDSFGDDPLALLTQKTPVADAEYIFDTSSGQCFASAGSGFAVATSSSLELLDENGQVAASRLMQMATPAIAACSQYAVFYDIGGLNIAVASFDGTVRELTPAGTIFSATVTEAGYLCVTTECAGYRGMVTVYDPSLDPIYEWYSSSAWIISAEVSPDGRSLAVVSYTFSGSEIRLFDMNKTSQKAAFSVSDTVLLDTHWFSAGQLCAYSTEQAFFFDSDGVWTNTYGFDGKFLIGCSFGEGFVVFALSQYRAGTTCTLVSCDMNGRELGTAELQSELISLEAAGTETLVLCPDSAMLFSSSLSQKGTISGLVGFKYGLLRSRGEALLISSGYAEVHTF